MRRVACSLALLLACSRDETAPAPVPSSTPSVQAVAPPPVDAGKPTRGTFSKELAEGRAQAHQKHWTEAIAAFERALASQPDDVVVLNELGWAAVNAGDDAKAKRATEHALALHPPPELEAQALYNEGRRLEALGQTERARGFYERSLADRENDTVRKRLEGLASDAGATHDAGAPPRSALPCTNAPGDEAELKRCFEAFEQGRGIPRDAAFFFEPDTRRTLPPGTSLYRFGSKNDARQQTTLLLTGATKRGLLPIAFLGTSTGHADVTASEKKPGDVWLVRTTVSRLDQSLSGLEVREESTDLLTACTFSATADPACPVQVPTQLHSKLAYPNLADLDVAERALVDDRIRDVGPPFDRRTDLEATLVGRAIVVTLKSGKKEDVPAGVLGSHPLGR